MDNRPIGVFDSGMGGLTTVRRMHEIMPNESIIFFGDTEACRMARARRRPSRGIPAGRRRFLRAA